MLSRFVRHPPSVHLTQVVRRSTKIPRKLSFPGSPSIKFSWFDGGRLSSADKRGRARCRSDFLSSDSRAPSFSAPSFTTPEILTNRYWHGWQWVLRESYETIVVFVRRSFLISRATAIKCKTSLDSVDWRNATSDSIRIFFVRNVLWIFNTLGRLIFNLIYKSVNAW